MNLQFKLMLFADYTSIIMCHPKSDHFKNCINSTVAELSKLCKINKLALNSVTKSLMKFATNNKECINLGIGYDNKTTGEVATGEFLGS
jgi:hypothetical protein